MGDADVLLHYFAGDEVHQLARQRRERASALDDIIADGMAAGLLTLSACVQADAHDLTELSSGGKGSLMEAKAWTFGAIASRALPFSIVFETYLDEGDHRLKDGKGVGTTKDGTLVLYNVRGFDDFEAVLEVQDYAREMPGLILSGSVSPVHLTDQKLPDLVAQSMGFVISGIYDGESLLLGVKNAPRAKLSVPS